MLNKEKTVQPTSQNGNSTKPIVIRSLPMFRSLFDELLNAGRDMNDRDRMGLYYLPADEYFSDVLKRYTVDGNDV